MKRENLINKRTELGFTQKELAQLANITTRQLQRIEAGRGNPSYNLALRLCDILGSTFEKLFS